MINHLRSSRRFLLCAFLMTSLASAQSITTTFASNNGGGSGWGNFFDIIVTGPRSIVIAKFDVNASSVATTPFSIDVYMTSKTYVGKDTKAVAWTKVASGKGVSKGRNNPTPVDTTDFVLGRGAYGMAIYYNGSGMAYTNGTGSNQTYKNTDVTLNLGLSKSALFGGITFTPRVWNGTIYYSRATTAFYGTLGKGCQGSAGVPKLAIGVSNNLPKLGSVFRILLSSMPPKGGFAVMITGFANNSFLGQPLLPLDLSGMGAKGCLLLTDVTLDSAVVNVSGLGTFIMPIPNLTVLGGVPIFQQALVLDPGTNPAGFTMTNAGGGRIGT